MSWYKDRQEQKARDAGFIITDSSSVGAAAWKAGMVGYMSVRSSLQDVADDMEESGFWAGITNMFTNASEESMPAIVAAHNDYVHQFRKAKRNPTGHGRYNRAISNPDKPHQGAMDHAWRYIRYKYPSNTPTRVKNSAGKWVDKVYPREEGWGSFPLQAEPEPAPAPAPTRGPVSIPGPGPRYLPTSPSTSTPPATATAKPVNYLPFIAIGAAFLFLRGSK